MTLVLVAACGDSTSPTAPTRPTTPPIPQVAGTYTGPFDLRVDAVLIATGTETLTVAQAGSQVTVTGAATFSELGITIQVPAVTGTINETGFFTQTSADPQIPVNPVCGPVTPVSSSLGGCPSSC